METKFLTSVVEKRKPIFDLDGDDFVEIIEDSLDYFSSKGQVQLHAYAIMPNHIHFLYSEPSDSELFRIPFIRFTAHEILRKNNERQQNKRIDFTVNKSDRTEQVWRRKSKLIYVRDERVFFAIRNYIRKNPSSIYWKDSINRMALNPRVPCVKCNWK
ncbi:MAG TPA: hypothetical protein DIW47_07090 [Bacteroidetes bacterium]|nr:hypothetical protein [Bacteroidota bacterium]